ncbi:MAG: ABC transporter permease, partial [Myxococcales bacterium]|nr:ABC transporter permease [Myxococcales bacterium]
TRLVRDELRALLPEDWVRAARAKGLAPFRVLARHVLRNALVPITTAAGLDLGVLFGGSIVTEAVFRWPGLGDLSAKAAANRDGPVLVGCVLVTSVAVVAGNLAADLLCARLDPRLR